MLESYCYRSYKHFTHVLMNSYRYLSAYLYFLYSIHWSSFSHLKKNQMWTITEEKVNLVVIKCYTKHQKKLVYSTAVLLSIKCFFFVLIVFVRMIAIQNNCIEVFPAKQV